MKSRLMTQYSSDQPERNDLRFFQFGRRNRILSTRERSDDDNKESVINLLEEEDDKKENVE